MVRAGAELAVSRGARRGEEAEMKMATPVGLLHGMQLLGRITLCGAPAERLKEKQSSCRRGDRSEGRLARRKRRR